MTPAQKDKKAGSSLPCEVFFACTRCGSRSRTVPQLHTHYRTVHKEEIANGSMSKDSEGDSRKDGDVSKDGEEKRTEENQESTIVIERRKTRSQGKEISEAVPKKGKSSTIDSPEKRQNSSDVIYIEGSKTLAKSTPSGPVINHPEKDCVITRKRNVPLGMLEGKKNSLMVIFQHSDQNKPLPEGSSFKLRNAGGEQTYLVVANVDVDIIEQGKPPKKMKAGK